MTSLRTKGIGKPIDLPSSAEISGPPQDGLAKFLGWFSLGLGVPQVTIPGAVNRLIGVRDDDRARFWQRVVGVRELGAAAGILGQKRPTEFLWARVAGDVKDLALLGSGLRKSERRGRTIAALANVAGILAVDTFAAVRNGKGAATGMIGGPVSKRAAITVGGPRADVERRWRETHPDGNGSVQFRDAPGDRGTEILLAMPKANTELRRFKQTVEAGEVPRSEATPEGTDARSYPKQRPAQPAPLNGGSR
jgi:hypothetical protein